MPYKHLSPLSTLPLAPPRSSAALLVVARDLASASDSFTDYPHLFMEVRVVQDPHPPHFGPNMRSFVLQDAPSAKSSQSNRLTSLWHTLRGLGDSKASGSSSGWKSIFMGWRIVLFHSWLNTWLVFIPIAWALNFAFENMHNVIFTLCVLSLVPLVRLHDLCTRELVIRIGGNKTGLLNASMSNMVELVIAISALRKCELSILQSALVGSILSKLLLVLGLCFFAGGLRFSEQGFDATATQIHSSLMSISAGAILLPAAYHFTLENDTNGVSAQQGRNILHMSHGVSLVLLIIYGAYLIFQLWSHAHFYHDKHNKKSQPLPVQMQVKVPKEIKSAGKRIATAFSALDLPSSINRGDSAGRPSPTHKPYSCSFPQASSSSITLDSEFVEIYIPTANHPGISTASLLDRSHIPGTQATVSLRGEVRGGAIITDSPKEEPDFGNNLNHQPTVSQQEPQLSWPLTLCLMLVITISVAITAESLVESMGGISSTISKDWVGLIVLPSVSAIAECITAVNVSFRDELTLSVSVAVGSSIQTALFVYPFMVILGWVTNKPLSLLLDPFQSLVLYLSVQIMSHVVADGKSNWFEGIILICLYVIVAVSFWFYPGSNLPNALAVCSVSHSDPL